MFERTKDLPQVDAEHQYAPDVEPLPEIKGLSVFHGIHDPTTEPAHGRFREQLRIAAEAM
jgi:hypothetical protein